MGRLVSLCAFVLTLLSWIPWVVHLGCLLVWIYNQLRDRLLETAERYPLGRLTQGEDPHLHPVSSQPPRYLEIRRKSNCFWLPALTLARECLYSPRVSPDNMLSGNKPTLTRFFWSSLNFWVATDTYLTDRYACANGNRVKICDSIITRVIYLKGIIRFIRGLSKINLNNQVPIHCDFLRFQPLNTSQSYFTASELNLCSSMPWLFLKVAWAT